MSIVEHYTYVIEMFGMKKRKRQNREYLKEFKKYLEEENKNLWNENK